MTLKQLSHLVSEVGGILPASRDCRIQKTFTFDLQVYMSYEESSTQPKELY